MRIDLHSHSTASDGELTPGALLERAQAQGLDLFSITDHDNLDAYRDPALAEPPIPVVTGVEFSTRCDGIGVHVLGLGVDARSSAMDEAVAYQRAARGERARRIGERLERRGFRGIYEQVAALADGEWIGRPHFAEALVRHHGVPDYRRAFARLLGPGKTGDVRHHWAELDRIVDWVRDAGGLAVLAHPLHYRLTATRLRRLVQAFKDSGGEGLEVACGSQNRQRTEFLAELCRNAGLLASCGSDFHRDGLPWQELGRHTPLPAGLTPVWSRWMP